MEDEVVQYNPPAKPIASDSEDVKGYEQQETA